MVAEAAPDGTPDGSSVVVAADIDVEKEAREIEAQIKVSSTR